jgi:hypothetical protein
MLSKRSDARPLWKQTTPRRWDEICAGSWSSDDRIPAQIRMAPPSPLQLPAHTTFESIDAATAATAEPGGHGPTVAKERRTTGRSSGDG